MTTGPYALAIAAILSMLLTGADARAQANPGQAQQPSAQPRDLTVAPNAPRQMPEARQQQTGSGQANVCEELAAHVRQAAAQRQTQSPTPNPGTADASRPAPGGAGPGQTAPPVDRSQQSSGQSAPIPDTQGAKTTELTIEQAEALLQANDQRACQKTVQDMRRAGVAVPPALLALAALREDLLASTDRQR